MSNNRVIATPADGVSLITVDQDELAILEGMALDENKRQQVRRAEFYSRFSLAARGSLCVRNGIYGLVTLELVEFIREHIAGRTAIEIGAGDGVLAQALGIPAIDNRMQEWPHVRAHYDELQQAPVRYGPNIKCMEGLEAVLHYRPQVVIGNWLTHLYRPKRHDAGGNMYAPDERAILKRVETFILIGNTCAHRGNSLLGKPHKHYAEPWMYSRAVRGTNFVKVWKGRK